MKCFRKIAGVLIVCAAVTAALWKVLPSAPSMPPVRALWVTRFDYRSPEDVKHIIRNIGQAGFTDVFFQIRGNATAYYASRLEPWAFELSGQKLENLGTDPGWNPLQQAVDNAKPYGLRVHAYMNVLPGWRGIKDPPAKEKQLWTEHPGWFMVDALGNKMLPTSGWYAFLNPVLPEVRRHLRGIARELRGYDIAGIHLDYIRYPHDYHLVARQRYPNASAKELLQRTDFSYDPVSRAALVKAYGEDFTQTERAEFRRDAITRLVRDLSCVVRMKDGKCLLTASVIGNPVEGKNKAGQDVGVWVCKGLVDWAVQMNYGIDTFQGNLIQMRKEVGKKRFASSVVIGVFLKNDIEHIQQQFASVERSGSRGIALFSYSLLFDETHQPTEKGRKLLDIIHSFGKAP